MYIISGFTGIVKNYFLLVYSTHKKPSTLAGLKSTFVFLIQRGITHTRLLCELRLLACVKDLLSRLFSTMLGIERLLTFLLRPCDAIAFPKISYILATSLSTSLCLAIIKRLSTESVAEARITLSVVSFIISYRW